MKMYLSLFRIRLLNGLQYRAVALGGILSRFLWGLLEISAYVAIYRTSNTPLPMELSETASYIWMTQVLFTLFSVVFGDGEIYSTIQSGSIAYELVRPNSLYWRWYFQSVANRLAFTLLNCAPALLLAFLIPPSYKMVLQADIGQLFLFFLSILLAIGVVVAFAMLMYISLFHTLAHRGIKIMVTAVSTFLSGGIIPLPFFPESTLKLVQLLPFASMQNTPLLIYCGKISVTESIRGIALQIFWLLTLISAGQVLMRHSLKKIVVQGG